MSMLDNMLNKNPNGSFNRAAFKILVWFIAIMGVFMALSVLFPRAIAVLLSSIWIILLVITIVFFTLGILVVIGLRKEAGRILDILMEGTLSLVDFLRFLKLIWLRFIALLKEFILYATPVIAYVLALVIYTLMIRLYKTYGQLHDITYFTIAITTAMVFMVGYLSKPINIIIDFSIWGNRVKKIFHDAFIDGLEIIIFIFFLTMDSTDLFFLPPELNIPLKAQFNSYNFMVRGYVADGHLRFTVNIIVFAIIVEIVRNVLRVGASARKHYTNDILLFSDGLIASRSVRVKKAIRKSFAESKDELVKFITFTTVLFAVFLVFPRLKLLTLAVASLAALLLDMLIIDRLFVRGGNDLISRLLTKVFKL